MPNLVTIRAIVFDASAKKVKNLPIMTRYAGHGSAHANWITSATGTFSFSASANRQVEIRAKPPNSDYVLIKVIDSSQAALSELQLVLPKSIAAYKERNSNRRGLVRNKFVILDSNGRILKNFPIQSRYVGGKNSADKYTDEEGVVEIPSSAHREIEVLGLNSHDLFERLGVFDSGTGNSTPQPLKLSEPYAVFKSKTLVKILDKSGQHYYENAEVRIKSDSSAEFVQHASTGEFTLTSMLGEKVSLSILKPNGQPLDSVTYVARRIKEEYVDLHLDMDVITGRTATNEPMMHKRVEDIRGSSLVSENFLKLIFGDRLLFVHRNMNGKNAKNTSIDTFTPILNRVLTKYGIEKRLVICHFLAQIFHESDHFNTLKEYADGSDYDISNFPASVCTNRVHNRNCNRSCRRRQQILAEGNDTPGDGPKYKGKGLIQITWKSTYTGYKNFTGIDVVSNPEELANNLEYAVDVSGWYWRHYKPNISDKIIHYYGGSLSGSFSESIHREVVRKVSRIVNGGSRGLAERQRLFLKILNEVERRNGF